MWPSLWPLWLNWREGRGRSASLGGTASRPRVRSWRILRRRARRRGQQLVADCAAFLQGDLAERLEREAGHVPVWVWTNRLAHASKAQLEAESGSPRPTGSATADRWRRVRAFLAGEVLEAAASYGSLASLQRDVLVPLELELSCTAETGSYGLGEWVAIVEAALREAADQHRG